MDPLKQQIAGEIALARNPGATIKKWREIFGITQTELADYLGITPSTISDYESNRRKSPGIGVIRRFVDALVDIDSKKGGWVHKKLAGEKKPDVFSVVDFEKPIPAKSFVNAISGRVVTNKRKLADIQLSGYSLVDSLRAILELPVDNFANIYGRSSNRAVVFTHVGVGRSPMVAIRVTNPKPSLVVYHGLDKMDDPIAKKISEVERIPIILTNLDIDTIKEKLGRF
ncbi:MAG: helix-turn-helix domain-containing protein [Candidatus Diapherotrites archaeon]|nr:helix-turn-helix domain-containing protein [Candidatus Diapherotrites archaeon]